MSDSLHRKASCCEVRLGPMHMLAPRQQGHVRVVVEPGDSSLLGDITISQIGAKGVEGGVTLRLADRK